MRLENWGLGLIDMISPPDGSKFTVDVEGGHQKIIMPQQSGGILRWFIGCFLLFWLGGWFVGWTSAASEIFEKAGKGATSPFLIFWLCGWTLGGVMAMWILYRTFRPTVPEVIVLTRPEMLYDSGVAPFSFSLSLKSQMDFWKKLFQKRIKTAFSPSQLKTLKLREFDTGNRLTIDIGSKRIDLAAGASEPEREWLFDVLNKHYNSW